MQRVTQIKGDNVVDWNEVIRTTPSFLRATVLIVLLGLITVAVCVISSAVFTGRELHAWGLQVTEYHPPDVQKCAAISGSIQFLQNVNQDGLNLLNSQIIAKSATAEKFVEEAAATNGRGGLSFVADDYRQRSKALEAEITDLQNKQNKIMDDRAKVLEEIRASCANK
jgi:hypothetical protein